MIPYKLFLGKMSFAISEENADTSDLNVNISINFDRLS
jgi:hypothetical protein